MSTPTTATATLAPQYNPQHLSHYPHHQPNYQPASSTYRPAPGGNHLSNSLSSLSNSLANGARLPPPYPHAQTHLPPPVGYSTASISHHLQNTIHTVHTHSSSTLPLAGSTSSASANSIPRSDTAYRESLQNSPSMPAPKAARANGSSSRKRRRDNSKPDWDQFYRNGLPKEVVIIHDTPEPDGGPPAGAVAASDASDVQPLAKRRKRESDVAALRQEHQTEPSDPSPTNTTSSGQSINPSGVTAPTSIGSSCSNSHYEYETQPGKRKRTTRQQANETKRLQAEALQDIVRYKTPSKPIKKSGEIKVRVIPDTHRNVNPKYDDDDGHYVVVPDADLTSDYQMLHLLGQGTFGKVVKARDRKRNKHVAIKIIRSVQKYREASRIELRVLATLKANDAENRNRCIHLRDCFDYRNHICIVMDLLDQSVFDFLKGNSYVPFPNSQIQSFARQLFTSVAFLHDLNLIHTDLKPENILLCNSAYQTFTYNRRIPSSSTTVNRQANKRKVLLDTEIRLIDFGSATFNDEYHSSVVSTRHYRAPEIILGLGWSFECDIWSIGCILVEFFTGDALFQTHDNLEHLAMMEAVVGSRIDQALVQQVNRATRNGNNPAVGFFKRYKLDYPAADTGRASKRFVRGMKQLKQIVPSNNSFLRNFLDLLEKIFVYDPKKRIKAKDALRHPWFQEAAYPDDGTEAAKIRRERMHQEGSRMAPLPL